jgi:hypothetical protein
MKALVIVSNYTEIHDIEESSILVGSSFKVTFDFYFSYRLVSTISVIFIGSFTDYL